MPISIERKYDLKSKRGNMRAIIEKNDNIYKTTIYSDNILIKELEAHEIDDIIDFLISIKISMSATY